MFSSVVILPERIFAIVVFPEPFSPVIKVTTPFVNINLWLNDLLYISILQILSFT